LAEERARLVKSPTARTGLRPAPRRAAGEVYQEPYEWVKLAGTAERRTCAWT